MNSVTRIAAAGVLAVGLTLAAVVAPAQAASPITISGTASCAPAGYTVTWTISSHSPIYKFNLPKVVAPSASRINYAAFLHTYPTTFTQQSIPATATRAQVSVAVTTRGKHVATLHGTVALPHCGATSGVVRSAFHGMISR